MESRIIPDKQQAATSQSVHLGKKREDIDKLHWCGLGSELHFAHAHFLKYLCNTELVKRELGD